MSNDHTINYNNGLSFIKDNPLLYIENFIIGYCILYRTNEKIINNNFMIKLLFMINKKKQTQYIMSKIIINSELDINNATTFTKTITASGGIKGTLTGNSDTATKLKTARTINGISFDGSSNIVLIVKQASAPTNTNQLWLNTSNGTLNYYDGTSWKSVIGTFADASTN